MGNIQVYGDGGQFEEALNTISVKIGKKRYDLLVAKTEEEKEKGLQDVESMESNDHGGEGMIFDYHDAPQHVDFWMKDTTIPLDIIFVDEDGEVISVKQGEPESEDYISEDNVAYVIELNQNSGVEEGDIVVLPEDFERDYDLEPNTMYIIGSDGTPQATLQGNERIVSRKETKVLFKKAKKAYDSKSDVDYRALGRYMFKALEGQDNRDPEYVKSRV